MNLAITASESEARRIWDANPHLAFAHPDFGAFRQAHELRMREHKQATYATALSLVTCCFNEREAAIARTQSVRDPAADVSAPAMVRQGSRLVCWLYGPVGYAGLQADSVREALAAHRDAKVIVLRIASAGGIAEDALAISTCIRNHPARVVAIVDRYAYSGATVIAAAADRLLIRQSASWMAHFARATQTGTGSELAARAAELRQLDMELERIYRRRRTATNLRQLMFEERYLSATEAVAAGVADVVIRDLPDLNTLEHHP